MTLGRLALRQHRRGMLSFASFAYLLLVVEAAGFSRVAGSTPAERLAFAREESALGQQFTWLYPPPQHIETLGGYLQWHVFSVALVVLAIWAVFVGTAAVGGDERRLRLDQWLAAGVRRTRLVAVRATVGLAVLLVAVLALAAGTGMGAAFVGEPVDAGGLASITAATLGVMAVCFALGLLVSQVLGPRRSATAATSALVVALFLLNGFARQLDGLRPFRIVSPFHWYDETAALAPGAAFHPGGLAVLYGTVVVLVAAAAVAFALRDTGGGLVHAAARPRPPRTLASTNPLLRRAVLSALWRERWAVAWWSAGTAVAAVFLTGVAKPAADVLESNEQLRSLLPALTRGSSLTEAYIGFAWFGMAALLTAAFAITDAARWTADDLEGRLAVELSAPVSRRRVVVERLADLFVELCVLSAVDVVAVLLGSSWMGLGLDPVRVAVAGALLVPVGLAFAGVGALLTAVRPSLTVWVLSTVAVAGYMLFALGPIFKLPAALLYLSPFHLYGTPLVEGVFVTGLCILLAAAAAGAAAALATMQRREIGS